MAYGDTPHDKLLKESWESFCERLKDAGDLIFRDGLPATGIDRAEGLRYVARNIPLAFAWSLEHSDPMHPHFMRYFEPTRKQGGDNEDALYLGAPLDPNETYRIVGNRGSVHYLAFTLTRRTEGPWGQEVVASLFAHELETEWDGSFTLTLSAEKHDGNWMQMSDDTYWITVRQFFGDWSQEDPLSVRIERVGADGPPPPLTPERISRGVRDAAEWLVRSTQMWPEYLANWREKPNQFASWHDLTNNTMNATPGGVPLCCYWKVGPDEVGLIEVTPPDAYWWNFEFGNCYWETMDYRHHMSSVNSKMVELEDDGSLRIAIAEEDPGLANWLDCCGHREGYVTVRWIMSEDRPLPGLRVVKRADLEAELPKGARRVDAAARGAELRRRQIGLERRFRA